MNKEVIIFNKINGKEEFGFSRREIADRSRLDASLISRFLTGKTDISVSKFFQLINSMPKSFQEAYWYETLNSNYVTNDNKMLLHWASLISEASYTDLQEILNAMALRWEELGKSKTKSKELAST